MFPVLQEPLTSSSMSSQPGLQWDTTGRAACSWFMWMDRQSPEGKGLLGSSIPGAGGALQLSGTCFKAETCRAQESQKRLTQPSSGCLGWESCSFHHREQQAPDLTASLKANQQPTSALQGHPVGNGRVPEAAGSHQCYQPGWWRLCHAGPERDPGQLPL